MPAPLTTRSNANWPLVPDCYKGMPVKKKKFKPRRKRFLPRADPNLTAPQVYPPSFQNQRIQEQKSRFSRTSAGRSRGPRARRGGAKGNFGAVEYHIPGYTGHVQNQQWEIGKSYSSISRNVLYDRSFEDTNRRSRSANRYSRSAPASPSAAYSQRYNSNAWGQDVQTGPPQQVMYI